MNERDFLSIKCHNYHVLFGLHIYRIFICIFTAYLQSGASTTVSSLDCIKKYCIVRGEDNLNGQRLEMYFYNINILLQ